MATLDKNTNPILSEDIISCILLRTPVKALLRFRSVSKSWLYLISSSGFIETHMSQSTNDIFSCLPKVLIYNIFLRLPVKTLLRLRSVSQSWLSLISSPEFIKTHLCKSTNDPHFSHHHLILSDSPFMPANRDLTLESRSLYSLLNEPVTDAIHFDFKDVIMDVVGYCNGLICLLGYCSLICLRSDDRYLILWNPFTRKSRRLPIIEHGLSYGFCYDESNDDFKVFAFFKYSTSEQKVSVYSLKSDSWRTIGDLTFASFWYSYGYFANGAMYWVDEDPRSQNYFQKSGIIYSLDIKTVTCEEILFPKYEGSDSYTLGTFGKSLSILYYYGYAHADFWVLNKCGVEVEESWTKLFTIPKIDELPTWYPWIKPLCISVNGDIAMLAGMTVVLYNPRDNTFRDLLDTNFESLYVDACVESLVSPYL